MRTNLQRVPNLRILLLLFAVLLPAANAAASSQDDSSERISRTIRVGRDGGLDVSNVSGDIVVRTGSGEEIQIDAVKRLERDRGDRRRQLDSVDVEIKEVGSRVSARVVYRMQRSSSVSVDFTITVPPGTSVTAKSVSGSIQVEKLKGELRAESVSGNVKLVETSRVALAKSVSGDVDVMGVTTEGYLDVSSVSGSVTLSRVAARELQVESVSGDVSVSDATCRRATLGSVSGEVSYTGELAEGGRYEFKSHSGDVDLAFTSKTGFEFEGKTFSGDIHSALPLTVSELRRGKVLRGVYGDGAAFVSATSFSGDVRVRSK